MMETLEQMIKSFTFVLMALIMFFAFLFGGCSKPNHSFFGFEPVEEQRAELEEDCEDCGQMRVVEARDVFYADTETSQERIAKRLENIQNALSR